MRYFSISFQKMPYSAMSRYPSGPAHSTCWLRSSGASVVTITAFTWNRGSAANRVSPGARLPFAAIIQAVVTWLAWVCAASFGALVVPPVWNSAARSSAAGGVVGSRSSGNSEERSLR